MNFIEEALLAFYLFHKFYQILEIFGYITYLCAVSQTSHQLEMWQNKILHRIFLLYHKNNSKILIATFIYILLIYLLFFSDSRSLKAAAVLLIHINNLVQMTYGNYCSELSLKSIVRSDLIIPPKEVIVNSRLYFGKVKKDGQAKGMFGKLRIIVMTTPGDAMFEATLQFRDDYENYSVLDDISRINQYGNQSNCIKDDILKKYCYCIQQRKL